MTVTCTMCTTLVLSTNWSAIALFCVIDTAWKARVSEPRVQAKVDTFIFGFVGGGSAIAGALAEQR